MLVIQTGLNKNTFSSDLTWDYEEKPDFFFVGLYM